MVAVPAPELRQRDDDFFSNNSNNDGEVSWWYSDTADIVKYTLFLTLALILVVWIVGGYYHAKKRIAKGLPPLAYHRWLISRRTLAQVDPRYAERTFIPRPPPDGYQMYSMPPPIYDPSRPPVYEHTEGMSKVNPTQEFQPPPGPPPPHVSSMPGETQPSSSDYQPPPGPPPPPATYR